MDTSVILAAIAAVFGGLTLLDWRRHGGPLTPRRRTWLLVTVIFFGVSVWLRFGLD